MTMIRFTDDAPPPKRSAKKYPVLWAEMQNLLETGEKFETVCVECASEAECQRLYHSAFHYAKEMRDLGWLRIMRRGDHKLKFWLRKIE